MIPIPLTNGGFALIDDEDLPKITGRQVNLGRFDTLEAAASAVYAARQELHTHSDGR